MERDLTGRCGTCGFFLRMATDANGVSTGECRLGCWPSPLKDTATCSSHKPIGQPFAPALKRAKVAGAPRSDRRGETLATKVALPEEIGIDMDQEEFRRVLREVLLDELGLRDAPIGERWQGGEIVLKPGKDGTQPKSLPIDVFFKKIVMIRDRLRVLEQKINAHDGLSTEDKLTMQQYVTACYGTLTTFNVLFRDRDDWFVGQSSKE